MEKSEIPTPRVDALDCGLYGYSDYARVLPQIFALARKLERELLECTEALRPFVEHSGDMMWWEQFGDEVYTQAAKVLIKEE